MTTMAQQFDDLGSNFEQLWEEANAPLRQELMAELQDIFTLLKEDDIPVLAPMPKPEPHTAADMNAAKPVQQSQLFFADNEAGPSESLAPLANTPAPRKENPFLPKSILDRLNQHHSFQPASTAAMPATVSGSHEQSDLERELRLKLGPLLENMLNTQMDRLKAELRVQLRAEMDKLIAERVRRG